MFDFKIFIPVVVFVACSPDIALAVDGQVQFGPAAITC